MPGNQFAYPPSILQNTNMKKTGLSAMFLLFVTLQLHAGNDDCPAFGSLHGTRTNKVYHYAPERRTQVHTGSYFLVTHKKSRKKSRKFVCCRGCF
jgi:hypothetical protein